MRHGAGSGLLVGLEVHQQLLTPTKLFCRCPASKSDELPYAFERRLRLAQSETGRLDPAAVFEFAKGKTNLYLWSPESACLVDADEEPPHAISPEAVDICIQVASLLHSRLVDESHVMRKIVIDGSNTTGFQRTSVIGFGGSIAAGQRTVGVQSITLEEDAARILGEDASSRRFALDRLGVPLIEVALDPMSGTPEEVGEVALHLGRVLRSTRKVARGLGTIRQDLNVSLDGGAVVEVKGVQKLGVVTKVVAYETARQRALLSIAQRLRSSRTVVECSRKEVTSAVAGSGSRVLREAVAAGLMVFCVTASGLSGILGWEPVPGVRLGKEAAEVARANSLGGVVHSDEFRKQGISVEEEAALRRLCSAPKDSALVLLAGPPGRTEDAAKAVALRLEQAPEGVPAETRAATEEGETRYMRPRPGAQRMYPETDIPQVQLNADRVREVTKEAPEPWETTVRRYQEEGRLSRELALRVFDSESAGVFEFLSAGLALEPSVIASTLVELPVRLSREGVPETALREDNLVELLQAMSSGKVAKEAAPEVLRTIGRGDADSIAVAMLSMGVKAMSRAELASVIDELLRKSEALVKERGEGAFSPLMGELMSLVRGKADGGLVSRLLREKLGAKLRDPRG